MTIDRPVRPTVSTNEGRDPRIRRAALHTPDGEECWVHTRGLQLTTWRMVDRTVHSSMTPLLTSIRLAPINDHLILSLGLGAPFADRDTPLHS